MNKTWFLAAAVFWPEALLNAQIDGIAKDVQLQEGVVKGARVVSRPDGTLIYPSEEMKNAATSGYNLLRMLPLPNVKVDDVKNILVLQNWLERIRKEVINKALSIKRISEFLNFPILAQPTLKKI